MAIKSFIHSKRNRINNGSGRIKFLAIFFMVIFGVIVIRLFDLQILKGGFYSALAAGQHDLYQKLFPKRGVIYIEENNVKKALVDNQDLMMLYAVPATIENATDTAEKLINIFGYASPAEIKAAESEIFKDLSPTLEPKLLEEIKKKRWEDWHKQKKEMEIAKLATAFGNKQSQYRALKHRLSDEQVQQIRDLNIKGLGFKKETWRFYPESGIGGQVFGFWGFSDDTRVGKYGLEGYYEKLLSGKPGEIYSEKDAWGNVIAIGNRQMKEKEDGQDLVLTIDRSIQYKACQTLYNAVINSKADGGSVVIMNPQTGAIIAMCGSPDYNPEKYNEVEDIAVYNNPSVYSAYEPGSIFKPLTLAFALDAGKIEPNTTYEDTGSAKYGSFTIKNFENKVYGRQTMTNVLENSINTGVIFAMEKITPKVFAQYVKDFGFGKATGIDLFGEMPGNIGNVSTGKEIYAATASFGQGLTATPIQMVTAIAAIANGGKLMKPYIVKEKIRNEKVIEEVKPQVVKQVISPKAASMAGAMMVSVVTNGHGKRAGVPGYRVAGKTGTAQIATKTGVYDANATIGSFIGFAPYTNPKFVMLVRIDHPRTAALGELVAAPVFGDIAKYILQYYNVPYDNPSDPNLVGK